MPNSIMSAQTMYSISEKGGLCDAFMGNGSQCGFHRMSVHYCADFDPAHNAQNQRGQAGTTV